MVLSTDDGAPASSVATVPAGIGQSSAALHELARRARVASPFPRTSPSPAGLLGEEVATVERELPIELVARESTGSPRR